MSGQKETEAGQLQAEKGVADELPKGWEWISKQNLWRNGSFPHQSEPLPLREVSDQTLEAGGLKKKWLEQIPVPLS